MPTYIALVQFTEKGIQAAKQTTQRVADWAARRAADWREHQTNVLDARSLRPSVHLRRSGRPDGRQRITGGGHAGQHPHTDYACFHDLQDGEDPGQGTMIRPVT